MTGGGDENAPPMRGGAGVVRYEQDQQGRSHINLRASKPESNPLRRAF